MKLHEVKVLADGKVYLDGGFILSPIPAAKVTSRYWNVTRLMGDDVSIAEARLVRRANKYDYSFMLFLVDDAANSAVRDYRGISDAQILSAFLEWVERQLKKRFDRVSEDLASDLAKARRKNRESQKTVWLHRLRNDGEESDMFDARSYYDSPEEAVKAHNNRVALNPNKKIRHNLVTSTELGTFKLKLSGKVDV